MNTSSSSHQSPYLRTRLRRPQGPSVIAASGLSTISRQLTQELELSLDEFASCFELPQRALDETPVGTYDPHDGVSLSAQNRF